jgi:hypothetical protein
MDLLLWLDNSSLADAVRSTTWVYPWVNAFHSVGMGFLVGVVFMICLRVLGFGRFPIAPLEKYLLVVRSAFVLSLATGFALFAADAERFFFSPTFRIKALLIVLGGVTAWTLCKIVFRDGAGWSKPGDTPLATKVIAGVSLMLWVGAIFAGRLTAYLP